MLRRSSNRMSMFCLVAIASFNSVATAQGPAYEALKSQAEAHFEQKSFAKARELYQRAEKLELSAHEKRWVEFRLADTLWRSQAATQTHDSTDYERAQKQLIKLISDIERVEDRDRVWAEVNESLGDFGWNGAHSQNWHSGWQYYQHALDWWAGAADIELARMRYLTMVWKMAEPNWARTGYEYHYTGNVPLNILDNAAKIAVTESDKAHAHFLIALNLRHNGDVRLQMRIADEFEAALAPGNSTPWYDDALYTYGLWLMQQGPIRFLENGSWTREPNFVKALAMFERLTREFAKEESRYWDEAKNYIAQIKNPAVSVSVSNVFLPNSEIQFHLSWRNVDPIELELFRVDLTADVNVVDGNGNINNWIHSIDLSSAEKIRAWTKQTNDKVDHKPGQSAERLSDPPGPGAYVIQAKAGPHTARDLILITDASIIVKTIGGQVLTYVCDALSSAPLPNATVHVWRMVHKDGRWHSSDSTKQADEKGLCVFDDRDFKHGRDHHMQYFITARKDDRQAFAQTHSNWQTNQDQQWRIYAFTDRPAYRPGEEVKWKIVARTPHKMGYSTPADQTIFHDIFDPRGSRIAQGTSTLNAFGSAWGSLELTESMPLGEYRITFFKDAQRHQTIGGATLFRLEEYKLPEFKVAIATPEENGRRKSYILGEYVECTIQADYYFGGPVANANVEVVVHQSPHYHWWRPQRDYPWIYQDENPYRWWGGGEQIIKRETLRTDSNGKAVLTFETPLNGQQDLQYRIEARVTDASRREITASDSVRVTRQRYYVHAQAKHNIHKPGDKIEIEFKAKDANDQPVQTEGKVKVTRDQWVEIWIDPAGKEVSGIELRQLQDELGRVFPPPLQHPLMRPWQLKFRGYKSEEILSTIVKLNEKGEATFAFTAGSEGYYRIHWQSEDTQPPTVGIPSPPITAQTYVWVATNKTTQLGYRHDGLQIIVDQDTFRSGQTAPVMIHTPTNDRYVLFSVEGEDLYSYQLVHVTGNVKLVQIEIDDRHVPNFFLSAMMSHNGELHQDQERIIVPPVEQYLKVDIASDREQYQPGDEGKFTIRTTDHDGKPVSAEVALAVTDEAVTYIQQDLAGDPRAFFFQRHQQLFVTSNSSFQQRSYVKLVKWNENQLIDERQREMMERQLGELSKDEAGQMAYGLKERGMAGGRGVPMAPAPASAMEGDFAVRGLMDRTESKLGQSMQTAAKSMRADDARNQAAPPQDEPAVVVRSDFRSTLVWEPSIITNESGMANVSLIYADSLTSWNAKVRVNGKGTQFGIGETVTRTKMPLIARLQAPRFFLVGDTVTISGIINNNTDEAQTVTPELHVKGLTLVAMLQNGQPVKGIGKLEIAANSEARVDWQITVESPGQAALKLIAKSAKYADAMEKNYTIHEHGIEKFIAKSGKVRPPGNDVTISLDIPSERKVESTALMVQISPSMAVTMLDALPYLIDYPYGCTEQTMSRFLPAAITAKTLNDLGIKPELAMAKVFGGIEQQFVDKTHPKGKQDLKKLDEITQASLNRLYDFQHSDGGWGWWKDGDSDHYMSAYVLWGLCLAKQANLDVKQDAIDRAAAYLDSEIVKREAQYDQQAWMLHALASHHATMRKANITKPQQKALDNIWTNREKLNAYTRSLLALSAHSYGDNDKARILVDNLLNGVKRDARPDTSVIVKGSPPQGRNDAVIGTAHWGEDRVWHRWSDGGIEGTAFALRAILAIDPKHELVEPVTNWLIKNRRGAQWSNTRDTAIVVLALNDYLRASGELAPEMEYELFVNGSSIVSKKLSADDVLSAPSRYAIDPKHIRDGANEIRIVRKNGSGPLYFAAEAKFFSLEDPVPPAGNEIFVRRDYFKLVPRPTLLKGYVYDRMPLADGGNVKSGERVEVVMTIEAKNNYEYLVFEDLKPAGLEAVAIRSGESLYAKQMKKAGIERTFGDGQRAVEEVMDEQAHAGSEEYTGQMRWVYQELRDRKVAMFIDRLPEGVWEIRYDLRAEVPGRFHALPVLGHAMYVPEIRANSAEVRISVTE